MKHIKSLLIFALLLCLLMQPVQALTGPVELLAPLSAREQLMGMVPWQGGLLVRTSRGFYHYLEDQEAVLLSDVAGSFLDGSPNVALLTADGAQLYGYHPYQGVIYPFSLEENPVFGEPITLDLTGHIHTDGVMSIPGQPSQFLAFEGRFYLLFYQDLEGGMEGSLLSFDLTGQDRREIDIPLVRQIAPFEEGQLLCLSEKEHGIVGPGVLRSYQPANGSITTLGETGQHLFSFGTGMLYDPALKTVYYQSGNQLYARDEAGQESLAAHLGSEHTKAGVGMALIRSGLVAYGHELGISIRQTEPPQLSSTRLVIRGGYPDGQHNLAASLMPEVQTAFAEHQYTQPGLQEALVLGEDGFDLFRLSLSDLDAQGLMHKGYARAFTSPALKAHMDRLYPRLRAAGSLAGKHYLVPVAVRFSPLYVNEALFREKGLAVPRSLEALFQLMTDYPEEGETPLFEYPPSREDLLRLLCESWVARSIQQGQPLSFADPDFIRLLEALGRVRLPARSFLDDSSVQALFPYGNELNLEYWSSYRAFDRQMEPLFLPVLDGEAPLPLAEVDLLGQNPHRQQEAAANAYVDYYVKGLGEAASLLMYQEGPEAIEQTNLEMMMERTTHYLQALKKAVEEAEGAEKSNLEQQLARYESSLAENLEKNRYMVSHEIVAEARALMQTAILKDHRFAQVVQAGGPSILGRALSGQAGPEQAARELDERLGLIQREQE